MKALSELLKEGMPVLVDFYATWCGPCRVMMPIVNKIERKYDDLLRVVKMDVDEYDAESTSYGVRAVPTLMLFVDGVPVWRNTGIISQRDLEEEMLRQLGGRS